MKNFMKEFKAFALKGNVMDMAIGVIIGGAFSTIVASLTENIINPIIGILFQADFASLVITLPGGVALGIGAFLSSIINFIILAFVLFCIVRSINKIKAASEKPAPAPAPAAPVKSDETKALEEIIELLKNQK